MTDNERYEKIIGHMATTNERLKNMETVVKRIPGIEDTLARLEERSLHTGEKAKLNASRLFDIGGKISGLIALGGVAWILISQYLAQFF